MATMQTSGGDFEKARALALQAHALEEDSYERRVHDRMERHVFTQQRQADLFAAVNARDLAERELEREDARNARVSRLADTLSGCLADGCTDIRVKLTSRAGREKEVTFSSATPAADFVVLLEDVGLKWKVERAKRHTPAISVERARFEANFTRHVGDEARRYLVEHGVAWKTVMALARKAGGDLAAEAESLKAKRWRAKERRWREVMEAGAKVTEALGRGETLERVLASRGVRPEVMAVEEFIYVKEAAGLRVAAESDRKLLELGSLGGWDFTFETEGTRPLLDRIVVVDNALAALAHYSLRNGEDGAAYIVVGASPLAEVDEDGDVELTVKGVAIEKALLTERWRAWEARDRGPVKPLQGQDRIAALKEAKARVDARLARERSWDDLPVQQGQFLGRATVKAGAETRLATTVKEDGRLGTVVLALGSGPEAREVEKWMRKVIPSGFPIEVQAPTLAATWEEELVKKERDWIRAQDRAQGLPRRLGRGLGLSP